MIPRRLEDLPHFAVSSIDKGELDPGTGYVEFRLHGFIDQPSSVRKERGWLLLPEQNCLLGDLASLDVVSGAATFLTFDEPASDLIGAKFPYVDGYWQAYHVWMVTEPSWVWNGTTLRSRNAETEIFEADETQIIDGREVRTWIRVKDTAGTGGKERLYPVLTGNPRDELKELLATGWDHEHCEICQISIGVGDEGFVDARDHWVCCACYAKYIATHDLSFLL